MTDYQFAISMVVLGMILVYALVKAPLTWWARIEDKKINTHGEKGVTEIQWVDMLGKKEQISFKIEHLSAFRIHLIKFKNSGGDEVSFYAQDIPKLVKALERAKENMWHDETLCPKEGEK